MPGRQDKGTMLGKIKKLSDISGACDEWRRRGKKIVLCHGVFDLFHIGHLRHFEMAKKNGDILIVSITGDSYVNKGPDRPVFPGELRCELLASLDIIDLVTVVEEHSALPIIETLKPDVYAKGGEYALAEGDITGKIGVETALVEKYGGRVIYTGDITFSSSNLLNAHFNLLDKPVRVFLDDFKARGGERQIEECFAEMENLKVLIVGETIIDEYQYVSPIGKAAKENIIATQFSDSEIFAGGVIAAANHLAPLCGELSILTMLGDASEQDNYGEFVRRQLDDRVELTAIEYPGAPTVRKVRFVEPTHVRKMFEVCYFDDAPLPKDTEDAFHEILADKIREADAVFVCDFGHGLISPETVDILQREAKFLAINVQSNSANTGYNLVTKYRRADFVCINSIEARLATHDKHSSLFSILGDKLPKLIDSGVIMITHGKHGCFSYDLKNPEPVHVPAFKHSVLDTIGAGDAFFMMAALFTAVGADERLAAFIGNVAGAIKVGVVGHRESISKLQLRRSISVMLK